MVEEDHLHCAQLLSHTNGLRCYFKSKSVKFSTPLFRLFKIFL